MTSIVYRIAIEVAKLFGINLIPGALVRGDGNCWVTAVLSQATDDADDDDDDDGTDDGDDGEDEDNGEDEEEDDDGDGNDDDDNGDSLACCHVIKSTHLITC